MVTGREFFLSLSEGEWLIGCLYRWGLSLGAMPTAVVGTRPCLEVTCEGEHGGVAGAFVFQELTIHHSLVKGTPEATINQSGLQSEGLLSSFLRGIKEAITGFTVAWLRAHPRAAPAVF